MTLVYALGGFILGAAAMVIYSLTHGAKVTKLGGDIMGEFQKVKDHLGIK